ncbi:hypothetical protein AVEN_37818-1 [Araneus ventricosus]|uniref:Uncharacterized protein n=1 Tax=Araneus ventricosus TaxID=182803 RepID=A0A4Y2P3W1_ARAVE|nr:hypothetical protein AVEN_37818-1 [Araneus ventricosus]
MSLLILAVAAVTRALKSLTDVGRGCSTSITRYHICGLIAQLEFSLVTLTPSFEATRGYFGTELIIFNLGRMTPELATVPLFKLLHHTSGSAFVRFSVHQSPTQGGFSVKSGFEFGTLLPRNREFPTRPPRPPTQLIETEKCYLCRHDSEITVNVIFLCAFCRRPRVLYAQQLIYFMPKKSGIKL